MGKKRSVRQLFSLSTVIVGCCVLALTGTAIATDSYTDLPARPTDPSDVKEWRQLIPGSPSGMDGVGEDTRAQTYFTDRAAFDAAAPGLPLEDFEAGNVAAGSVETCSDPYDSSTSDACWAPGDILDGISLGSSSGGGMVILGDGFFGGSSSIITGANTFTDYTYINFSPAVNAIGMDLLPANTVTINLYDVAGGLLATTAGTGGDSGLFWGVVSDEQITRIEIAGDADAGEVLDNLAFGAGGSTLLLGDITFDDICASGNGGGNGIAEPNELIDFFLQVTALGDDFTGVTGTVTMATAGVTIVNATYDYGTITDGSAITNSLPYEMILDGLACGDTLDVQITVTSNEDGPFVANFTTSIGQDLAPTVPVDIPDSDPMGISSSLVVADDVTLTDVNVYVEIDHTWVGDLTVWLQSPGGSMILLLEQVGVPVSTYGCGDNNMAITFDDDSVFDPEDYCSGSDPWYSGDAMPVGSLADLNGESSAGTWLLWASDNAGGDTGQIVDWQLITDPVVSGVCIPCDEPVQVQVEAIPTLGAMGILALIALLACAALVFIRRS